MLGAGERLRVPATRPWTNIAAVVQRLWRGGTSRRPPQYALVAGLGLEKRMPPEGRCRRQKRYVRAGEDRKRQLALRSVEARRVSGESHWRTDGSGARLCPRASSSGANHKRMKVRKFFAAMMPWCRTGSDNWGCRNKEPAVERSQVRRPWVCTLARIAESALLQPRRDVTALKPAPDCPVESALRGWPRKRATAPPAAAEAPSAVRLAGGTLGKPAPPWKTKVTAHSPSSKAPTSSTTALQHAT